MLSFSCFIFVIKMVRIHFLKPILCHVVIYCWQMQISLSYCTQSWRFLHHVMCIAYRILAKVSYLSFTAFCGVGNTVQITRNKSIFETIRLVRKLNWIIWIFINWLLNPRKIWHIYATLFFIFTGEFSIQEVFCWYKIV